MHRYEKIYAMMLLLCMCLLTFTACIAENDAMAIGTGPVTTPKSTTADATDKNAEADDETTPKDALSGTEFPSGTTPGEPYVPKPVSELADTDLGEKSVRILAWNNAFTYEFENIVSTEQPENINEAIIRRNESVNKLLNCKLEFVYTPGGYADAESYIEKAKSYANGSGSERIDILAAYSLITAHCSTKGLCENLLNYTKEDGLNLENPWWPDTLTEELASDGSLFLCTGDISSGLVWNMDLLYFSRDAFDTVHGEKAHIQLYKLVNDGKWTVDKFYEYTENTYKDLNADNTRDENDRYGFAYSWDGYVDGFYTGAGFSVTECSGDKHSISAGFGGEIESEFLANLTIFTHYGDVLKTKDIYTAFSNKNILFVHDNFDFAAQAYADQNKDIGILPVPKLDQNQSYYRTSVRFPFTLYAISSTSASAEDAAIVLEAMARQGNTEILPVVFEEVMRLKYAPDLDDSIMLGIAKESISLDFGRIYAYSLNNYSVTIARNAVKNNSDYADMVKYYSTKFNDLFGGIVKDLASKK